MTDLNVERFADYFKALWGYPPFAWQYALAKRAIEETARPWPEAIKLPTAAGKTACLDIAVYALAAAAQKNRRAPRRIFFVVDRRVIVDEAFERARKLARKLWEAEQGVLRQVADALRELAGADIPLMCFQLRGGMYRSDAWARSPLQPAIIATTVDQIGSRILFRAYGRSSKAWPIQAGLTANDALILLDEAHCSQPFMETLHAIRKYRLWADKPLPTPFHVTIMSATPPKSGDIFQDTSTEPKTKGHPLGDRQLASKKAELKLGKAKGKKAREQLARELVETAETLVQGTPMAVVIFANYVATAREAYRLLKSKHGEHAILLTGRMRPIDKDDTITERLYKFDLASSNSVNRKLEAPVFVVATQTLEVGADLDFDALVTECASLDALRQRFGRLNRMGRDLESKAVILMRPDLEKKSADDPVYGESLSQTWQWLKEQADENGNIDMGIAALSNILPDDEALQCMNAPSDSAPVMLPAHVDCWAQTGPAPVPTPDVSVFLHGPARASGDVQVCWRADIELENPEASLDVLSQCPPAAAESLPVPIWMIRRWLLEEEVLMGSGADVEGIVDPEENKTNPVDVPSGTRRVIRWRGRDEASVINDPEKIHPGDIIVIPSGEKGWDTLGDILHSTQGEPVLDWGDRAHMAARGRALLRLHPSVIRMWPDCASKSIFIGLAESAEDAWEEDSDPFVISLREAMYVLSTDDSAPIWLSKIGQALYTRPSDFKRTVTLHPLGKGVIVRGRGRIEISDENASGAQVDWFTDEDDASASGTVYASLNSHLDGVASLAEKFAKACALPDQITQVVKLAGQLHDTGKADPRFQALLRGGTPWTRGELLAKSEGMPQGRVAYLRARKAAGYPENGRHELLSIRLAESGADDLLPKDSEHRELLLHLIASHHGHCRPFAPVIYDPKAVDVSLNFHGTEISAASDTHLEKLDSGISERFWRLTRRYGWWGLAWLETIVRLADHRRSEWEEKQGRREL